jgi:hypothetical protein
VKSTQATSTDDVSIVRKALDLFQRGACLETLYMDEVVPLANTRAGEEFSLPFKHLNYVEVVNALQQLEKTGYNIRIENDRIRFTRYPRSLGT